MQRQALGFTSEDGQGPGALGVALVRIQACQEEIAASQARVERQLERLLGAGAPGLGVAELARASLEKLETSSPSESLRISASGGAMPRCSSPMSRSRTELMGGTLSVAVPGSSKGRLRMKLHPGLDRLPEVLDSDVGRISIHDAARRGPSVPGASRVRPSLVKSRGPYWFQHAMDPGRARCVIFNAIGVAVMLYDVAQALYAAGLGLEVEGAAMVLTMLSSVYWTFDFAAQWVTGYFSAGELVLDFRSIRRNYLRTWFLLDVIILSNDYIWIVCYALQLSYFAGVGKLLKLIRLARLVRISRSLDRITNSRLGQQLRGLNRMLSLVFGILLFTHFVSCSWCAIGRSGDSSTGLHWLDYPVHYPGQDSADVMTYREAQPFIVFLAAFHWTMAQFTPGNILVTPMNAAEEAFNILVLVCGLLGTSLIISLFSGQITQHVMQRRLRTDITDSLRYFLLRNRINSSTTQRVMQQLAVKLARQQQKVLDVPGVKLLSATLRSDLMLGLFQGPLQTHGLFEVIHACEHQTFKAICERAVDQVFLASGEQLFLAGALGQGSYYVVDGSLVYDVNSIDSTPKTVACGRWASEAALFCVWRHRGTMTALRSCECLCIMASTLYDVVQDVDMDSAKFLVRTYGHQFYKRLADDPLGACDLHVPRTSTGELLGGALGPVLLDVALLSGKLHLDQEELLELREAVEERRCWLEADSHGKFHCVEQQVELRIFDGTLCPSSLFRVGRLGDGFAEDPDEEHAPVGLPTAHVLAGTSPEEAYTALLGGALAGLVQAADVLDVSEVVDNPSRPSRSMSIQLPRKVTTHKYEILAEPVEDAVRLSLPRELWPSCPIPERPLYVNGASELFVWLTEEEEDSLLLEDSGLQQWRAWLRRALDSAGVCVCTA